MPSTGIVPQRSLLETSLQIWSLKSADKSITKKKCTPEKLHLKRKNGIERNSQDFEISETSEFSWDRSSQLIIV